MLEIILILLGLAFPNSDVNTQSNDNPTTPLEISTSSDDDTGGQSVPIPPKK